MTNNPKINEINDKMDDFEIILDSPLATLEELREAVEEVEEVVDVVKVWVEDLRDDDDVVVVDEAFVNCEVDESGELFTRETISTSL